MSATEIYLKEAQRLGGVHHKLVISNLRQYLNKQPEEEIISAINKMKDPELIRILWEVGLSQNLQDVASQRHMNLAGSKIIEVR